MTILLALAAGTSGAMLGFMLGAGAASVLAGVLGISSFEGAAGYFAAFVGGPIGGLIGLVLGVWLASRLRGERMAGRFGRTLGIVAVVIVAVAAGALYLSYEMRPQLASNGPPPRLEFEIRLPAGAALPPSASAIDINLDTSKNRMPGNVFADSFRRDGDRPVIVGSVDMYFRTSQRLLVLRMPGSPDQIFQIKLGASPKHAKEFAAWQRVDFVDVPGQDQPRKGGKEDGYEIRYRAVWAGED